MGYLVLLELKLVFYPSETSSLKSHLLIIFLTYQLGGLDATEIEIVDLIINAGISLALASMAFAR